MTPPALTASVIKRVAVIDDDSMSREATEMLLHQIDLTTVPVRAFYKSVSDLVNEIKNSADAAVIDHRLQPGNLGPFFGAEAVAALIKDGRPAILTTQYFDQDFDATIRIFREWIPVAIAYDDVGPEQLIRGLAAVQEELAGKTPASRRPHRTQLVVKAIRREDDANLYDAVIPSWNAKRSVSFPAALVDASLGTVKEGEWLEADVNIEADSPQDLFFRNFTRGTAPDPDDGLA